MRIIDLLQQKNHYLEKFYSLNQTEILSLSNGAFENLNSFYQDREKILDIIQYIDHQLFEDNAVHALDFELSERDQVKQALAVKDQYAHRILDQDLEILSLIEKAKSNIIVELTDIRKAKKAIGSYKSGMQHNSLSEKA